MEVRSGFAEDVLVVIVIYEIHITASSTFRSLEAALQEHNQRLELLIYDNSLHRQNPPSSNHWAITYEHHPENRGVSSAYNKGLEVARLKSKKWLWLLDQDAAFAIDAIQKYESKVSEHPTEKVFIPQVVDQKSFLSPFKFVFGGGKRVHETKPGIHSLNSFFFINSGILISIQAFESVDGYSTDFPLDFSDIDFIIRLRKKIHRVVVLPTKVKHNLSSSSSESLTKKVNRFSLYLQAANRFRINHKPYSRFILLRTLLRAVKLSLKHNTFDFLKVFRSVNF